MQQKMVDWIAFLMQENMDAFGISGRVRMRQKTVIWMFCNGQENMDVILDEHTCVYVALKVICMCCSGIYDTIVHYQHNL
jgi:hypothetical protein